MDDVDAGLDRVRHAPADRGPVELIVRRPAVGEREILAAADVDLVSGLAGDTWSERPSRATPDGSPDQRCQITIMGARAAALLCGPRDQWPLAGDQLFVDLDISTTNLPPGTLLDVGTAVLEVSAHPHTGCAKFQDRFGTDALRLVNSPAGRELRLRGLNARVVVAGSVAAGDEVRKRPAGPG